VPQPAPIRLPLQFFPFRHEQFQSKEGITAFNGQWQQVINAINAVSGNNGPAVIPGGVDVQGASITGLGAPKSPTDAVSAGHAAGNYGASAVSPQLDIGGTNTLKGLAYVSGQVQKNNAALGNLPSTYAGGGVIDLFGFIVQLGFIADMDTAVFPMAFPQAFPNACQSLIAFTTGPNDRITYASVLPTTTHFTLANNGAGAGAFWIAGGW